MCLIDLMYVRRSRSSFILLIPFLNSLSFRLRGQQHPRLKRMFLIHSPLPTLKFSRLSMTYWTVLSSSSPICFPDCNMSTSFPRRSRNERVFFQSSCNCCTASSSFLAGLAIFLAPFTPAIGGGSRLAPFTSICSFGFSSQQKLPISSDSRIRISTADVRTLAIVIVNTAKPPNASARVR